MPRLFRPFTQLDSGVTRRYGGTGLGLYISHRLATLLQGTLTVESVVGEGSIFTLRIPAQPARPEALPS
jgi:signal transduction histidine kinase